MEFPSFIQRLSDGIRDGFIKNPFAWILAGLLIVAEFGNYQYGKDISRLCELTGPHDVSVPHPATTEQEIDNICIGHEPADPE